MRFRGPGIGLRMSPGVAASSSSYWTALSPTNLVATVLSSTSIKLDWTNNDTTGDGVSIERSTDGITYTEIGTVVLGVTTYSDTTCIAGTLYYYRVRAFKN